jgi:hypothetical protein
MRCWKKVEASRPAPNTWVIDVKDEGLYGFTIVGRHSTGPEMAPHAGDVPQVWVTVDTTKPEVQLNGVELNLTSKTPDLVVRWTARDKCFNKRPITLSMAERAEGPWTPLAAGIENTGHYEIPLTPATPRSMYLRVEAVDLAGNVGMAQTPCPVRLEFPWQTTSATIPTHVEVAKPPAPPHSVEMPQPPISVVNIEVH